MTTKHTKQMINYLIKQDYCNAELEAYNNLVNELEEKKQNSKYQLFAIEDEQKGEMCIRIVVYTDYGPIIKTITRTPPLKEMKPGVVKLTYEGFVPDEYHLAYLASMGKNHTRYIKATASYGEISEYDVKSDNPSSKAFPELLARIRITEGKYRFGKWVFENCDSTDQCYNDFVGKNAFIYDNLFDQDTVQDFERGIGWLHSLQTPDSIRFGKECAGPFWHMQHYFNIEAEKVHVPTALIYNNTVRKPDLQNYSQEYEIND